MAKILVLGGGYVGSRAGIALKTLGHEVQVYSRKAQEGKLLWQGMLHEGFDTCLFCVAPDTHTLEDYTQTYLDNAKILAKSKLKRIIYTSSTSVYSQNHGQIVLEDEAILPTSPTSKILYETENTLLNSDKTVLCFRLGEINGPERSIRKRLEKLTTPLPGDGSSTSNISPIVDIIEGIKFGFQKDLSGIYNLVSDIHLPRKELYQTLFPDLKVTWNPSIASTHGGNKIVSNAKLKAAGFSFSHSPIF